MSIEALRWALDIGEELNLEPPRRLVLIMLGNSADHAGANLFPSYSYLSRRTGLAHSTIRGHVSALVKAGLLERAARARGDGGQTSNEYRLTMRQPGLPLGDDTLSLLPVTPPPESSRGGVPAGTPPASQPAWVRSHHKDLKQERSIGRGAPPPSPVARGFKVYADGIKRRYGADYPPSKRINGMLANVVGRVGADNIEAVVAAYVGSQDPWYAKVKHKPEFLVRDCEQLLMDAQRRAGGGPPATKATVRLVKADEEVARDLGEFPVAEPVALARRAREQYARMIDAMRANKVDLKYIDVLIGGARTRYAIEELQQ